MAQIIGVKKHLIRPKVIKVQLGVETSTFIIRYNPTPPNFNNKPANKILALVGAST